MADNTYKKGKSKPKGAKPSHTLPKGGEMAKLMNAKVTNSGSGSKTTGSSRGK